MAGPRGELPERLLDSGATDFERRLLNGAATRGPSREMSRQMASALGVSLTTGVVGAAAGAKATAATAAGAKSAVSGVSGGAGGAGGAGGSTAGWAWIAGGIVAVSVVGALVAGGRSRPSSPSAPGAASGPIMPTNANTEPIVPVAAPSVGARPNARPSPVSSPPERWPNNHALGSGTLRDEIELLDRARAAVTAKAGRRALELLGDYERTYVTGSLLPEATALKVEALVQLGRIDEARLLAERFVIQHRGSVLSDRVAAVAGLSRP